MYQQADTPLPRKQKFVGCRQKSVDDKWGDKSVRYSDRESLRAHAPSASWSNPYNLSSGEFDVARLLGRGLGLAEIAETLGLTGRSTLSLRDRLMQKLGARNLAHLEHIISTLGRIDTDWSETIYLDDGSDGLADDEEPEVIFAD